MKEQQSEVPEPPYLVLRDTRYGKGVFANRNFSPGDLILKFRGRLYHKEEYLKKVRHEKCHFLQVDSEWFLGPTRSLDNFVNHSCDPNCGFQTANRRAYLFAIRPIEPGEEITFDYSTSMAEDHWEMNCGCGTHACRGRIRDFKHLPPEIQMKYISLQAAPDFVLQSLREQVERLQNNHGFLPHSIFP